MKSLRAVHYVFSIIQNKIDGQKNKHKNMKLPASVLAQFKAFGAIGGRKAKHTLSPERAREMALIGCAKRAKLAKEKAP